MKMMKMLVREDIYIGYMWAEASAPASLCILPPLAEFEEFRDSCR